MKRIKFIIVFVFFAVCAFSQHTLDYTNDDAMFEQGKSLFEQRKYAASYRCFEKFLQTAAVTNAGQAQEAEFYIAANAYELRRDNAEKLLAAYLVKHPYTPFADRTNFMLGTLRYENRDYEDALLLFEKTNEKHLVARQRTDFQFRKAYSYLELQEYRQALPIFMGLKNLENRYKLSSTYYYAYCEYCNKNYAAALPDFLNIEKNEQYQNIVPYYIIQIYYAQKKYDELTPRAETLLKNNPKSANNAEIYRILGEIVYEKRDFSKAISYLKNYEELSPQVLRNDMYLLGLCYYETKNYADAVKYLSKATTVQDEMSENAYLHLGNAYIKLGDKTNARLAFEAALHTKFNSSVREEAMYNYALTSYETTTVFGESITAFSDFLNEFPTSSYANQAKNHLASILLTTTNYSAAYDALQKIKNPNEKLLNTRQYLLYQMGTEAFRQNDFTPAIAYFDKALEVSTTSKYAAESYFWRSESYYHNGENEKSVNDLKSFFANPNARNSENFAKANYSMAYAYFSEKNYSEALDWFLRYVETETRHGQATFPDALNRIGDCYFNARNLEKANEFYQSATAISPNTADYAQFQMAYAAGLQKRYAGKIALLNKLQTDYPNSEYADDALYETGRAYVMLGNEQSAIEVYKRLLEKYPNSDLARKAALETGMFYLNANNQNDAIVAYKNVISSYPGSEEAYTALESLEQIYIENNDVEGFLAYSKSLNLKTSSTSEHYADSISY
ncbi:MAG: tetratricopeptide repeat protein, partial [Paludibacter sp.]|nr:tetratricopeptide repeat protein [Paludibacter sp.]